MAATTPESAAVAEPSAPSRRRVLHPPGRQAASGKADKFARLLWETLEDAGAGGEAELAPIGVPALWHSLRALCTGPSTAEFEVVWGSPGEGAEAGDAKDTAAAGESDRKGVRLIVRRGQPWEEFSHDVSSGHFVSKTTQTLQLAKKLVIELRKCDASQAVTLHTYSDAEAAVATILKAIASVPTLADFPPLLCSAGSFCRDGETVPRVVVHVTKAKVAEDPAKVFVAYPPGGSVDAGAKKRFEQSVRGRMGQGETVVMKCRGSEASVNAMVALASVKGRVARFAVEWVDGSAPAGDSSSPKPSDEGRGEGGGGGFSVQRHLSLRAEPGATWAEFNATDFERTNLLKASDKVKDLAIAIGRETKKLGAVAVHAYAESRGSVYTALKAIASVPTENPGLCVTCVPSFGWAYDGAGGRKRSLRFYIQQAPPKARRS